jgi:hypothetical protein
MELTMRLVKCLLPLIVAMGFVPSDAFCQLIGQETNFDRALKENDEKPVREFIESKEDIDLKDKASHLEISGDVRFEYEYLRESINGTNLRGHDSVPGPDGLHLSNNDYDIEFNLKFDYTYGRAWAKAHFLFDNPAGINEDRDCYTDPAGIHGSGFDRIVKLKRAYMGYNVWADGCHRFDIELGRRKLNDVFDSEIQFGARFDGLLLKYTTAIDQVADFYWYGGAFIIDERVNFYGYVTELGVLNAFDTGLDIRYSYIDWMKHRENRCDFENPWGHRFRNSQISLTYNFNPDCFCGKQIEIYGAFLVNHAARKHVFFTVERDDVEYTFELNKRKNLGWYIGLYIGDVEKAGDWAFDVNYQVVQAQAVPDADINGISNGNIWNERFYALNRVYNHPDTIAFTRRGNGNYKGWRWEFLYAITDNLSIDTVYQYSVPEDSSIGDDHRYSNLEIEAIYAF